MSAELRWTKNTLHKGFIDYRDKVRAALRAIAQYWAAVFERYAKEEAPWTDRTANARQSLHAWIKELSKDTVALYLSHGMEYGIFLESMGASETSHGGRWSIVWPTIEAHLEAISKMLKQIFS